MISMQVIKNVLLTVHTYIKIRIFFLDMQKFPLRMKDNDLLVTELYRDTSNDPITAISVYLTPKTSESV